MTQTPTYSYDKEADVLYVSFAPGEKATTAVELNDNILLRFNRAENAPSFDAHGFLGVGSTDRTGSAQLPLTGLNDLEPECKKPSSRSSPRRP